LPPDPEDDHTTIIRIDERVKTLVDGLNEIKVFLKDCPAHREKVNSHLEGHKRVNAGLLAAAGVISTIIAAIVGLWK